MSLHPLQLKFYRTLMQVRPTVAVSMLKRVLRLGRRVITNNVGTFWVDPLSDMGQGILAEAYEPVLQAAILENLPSGGVFIDVGSNEGFYAVLAAKQVGAGGRVVAIEPQQRLIPVIERNVELNHFKNVTVVNAALSDGQDATGMIWLSPSTIAGGSSLRARYKISQPQAVALKSMDTLFDECAVATADVVKIDVEGFEQEVIRGSTELLKARRIALLMVEYHEHILNAHGLRSQDSHDLICSFGYTCEHFNPSGYNFYYAPQAAKNA